LMLAVRNNSNYFKDKEFGCARACCMETAYGTGCIVIERGEQRRFFRAWKSWVHDMPPLVASSSEDAYGDASSDDAYGDSSSESDSDAWPRRFFFPTLPVAFAHGSW
jgi:hypothetical protein